MLVGFPKIDGPPFWIVNKQKRRSNYTGEWFIFLNKNKKYTSVVVERLIDYTRYAYICMPENWMLKN